MLHGGVVRGIGCVRYEPPICVLLSRLPSLELSFAQPTGLLDIIGIVVYPALNISELFQISFKESHFLLLSTIVVGLQDISV